MPRASKCRKVCFVPQNTGFTPDVPCAEEIGLTLEEFEALRLIDLEGLGQAEAAQSMGVSRGTVQRILYAARHKSAEAIVTGKGISIGCGHYLLAGECRRECRRCGNKDNNKGS
ncbi:MAG: DUF134 domain-containing protein [Clostridia bacterium]|nr:DUF134 domain-containing protein [Clostridia bacterium]